MNRHHADISPIYDRGIYKRKGSKPNKNTNDEALDKACKRFGANLKEITTLKALERGKTLVSDDPLAFNHYGRATAALNSVKAFGEFYILPKRLDKDVNNKITVKISSTKIKSYIKPGEIIGFTITRL